MNKAKYYLVLIIFIGICIPSFSQSSKDVSELIDSVMYNDSLAAFYGEKGMLSKAREYASRNVAINSLYGNKTVPYAISLLNLSKYFSQNEENKYKSLAEEGLAILKDSLGIKSPIYTTYLLGYAWRQYNSDQIQDACNIIKDVAEGGFISEDPLTGNLYYSYAHFLRDNGEIDKARNLPDGRIKNAFCETNIDIEVTLRIADFLQVVRLACEMDNGAYAREINTANVVPCIKRAIRHMGSFSSWDIKRNALVSLAS